MSYLNPVSSVDMCAWINDLNVKVKAQAARRQQPLIPACARREPRMCTDPELYSYLCVCRCSVPERGDRGGVARFYPIVN